MRDRVWDTLACIAAFAAIYTVLFFADYYAQNY